MSSASRHYVLAAGGTGGHLIPAFALAVELEARGHHVALITDERGSRLPGKPPSLVAHVLPAGRLGKNPLHWPRGIRAIHLMNSRIGFDLLPDLRQLPEPPAVVVQMSPFVGALGAVPCGRRMLGMPVVAAGVITG